MERMDRARRFAGVAWAVGGVLAMLLWSTTGPEHPAGGVTWAVAAVVMLAVAAQVGSPRITWWGSRVAAASIGTLLLGAVADRFGVLGAPGAPGVSWGDWAHFRAETTQLVPWAVLVQPAAVAATIAEVVIGGLLVIGAWWRWTGKAGAGLFCVYLVTMIPGMGAGSVLEFGVPVLIGGSLLASARGPYPGSDRGRRRHLVRTRHTAALVGGDRTHPVVTPR